MRKMTGAALTAAALLLSSALTACADGEAEPTDTITTQNTSVSEYYLELDPNKKFESSEIEDDAAYVIAEPEGTDIIIYGVTNRLADTVIIEHNGVTDYFPQSWLTPRAILPVTYYNDFDGDGENELAVIYYVGSGTGVSIEELVIYEENESGSFEAYTLENDTLTQLMSEKISFDIDNENQKITFTCADSGDVFTADTSEYYPDGIGMDFERTPQFGSVVKYTLTDDGLTLNTSPSIMLFYECMPNVSAKVNFIDGKYSLSGITLNNPQQ